MTERVTPPVDPIVVLRRLASNETFTVVMSIDHATPEVLAAELRARIRYAADALRELERNERLSRMVPR